MGFLTGEGIGATKKSGGVTGSFLSGVSYGKSTGRGRPDIAQQVADLTALQQQTGAPAVDEDQPGFLARAIDVLSGFNYAAAGATEEIQQGKGLPSAAKRFAAELYSSARSLPFAQILPELGGDQKKAFGEVLKGMGVGTVTLGDIVPMMEGTFVGELINTRGTLGVGLDIVSDPLTYFSFGLSTVAKRTLGRFAAQGVKKGVTPKGLKVLNGFEKEIRSTTKGLADEAVEEMAAKRLIDAGDKTLFDEGGMKIAGWAVPGTQGIGRDTVELVSKPIVAGLNRFGIGRSAVRSAETYYDAIKAIGRETFSEFGPLEKLSGPLREGARRVARKYVDKPALLFGRYVNRIRSSSYMDYLKKNPSRIEHMVTQLDNGTRNFANDIEAAAADELSEMLREIGEEGVELGIFEAKQIDKPSFILHNYQRMTADEVSETWRVNATQAERMGNKHAKSRDYATVEDAKNISGKRAAVSQEARRLGMAVEREVQLVPDYSLEGFEHGLLNYTDWYSKQKTVRMMTEDFRSVFGFDKAKWSAVSARIMDGAHDFITTEHKEWNKVMSFFEDGRLGKMAEEAAWNGTGKASKNEGFREVVQDALKRMEHIRDPAARKQFGKELLKHTDSMSQFVNVWDGFEKAGKLDLLPHNVINLEREFLEAGKDGMSDALMKLSENARYTSVGGGSIWGKGEAMVPKLIVDYVENANSNLLNTKDFAGFRTMVRNWDKVNNLFKQAVYPFFPSSQFRNAYSNVSLMGLRIGWHALDPSLHKHSVAALAGAAGEFIAKNGRRYSYDELRDLIQLHNIKATGRQLVETTGEGARRIGPQVGPRQVPHPFTGKGRQKALNIVANVENESRVALFTQGLLDGLNPEEAAADVAEFLFNYNELGPIHRDFIRRIIPFSTFSIKNIRAQTKALVHTPGRVINQIKPFRGDQSENDQMVKFEAEGMKLRLDKDGRTVTMLTGIDLPLRNLDNIWAGGFGNTGRRLIGMMSPLIKTPIELASRRDMFTGGKLNRAYSNTLGVTAEHLPKPVKDWIGYKKDVDEVGRATYSFDGVRYQLLVRSFVFSRIMSTSDRQFRDYAKDAKISSMFMDVLTGLRLKDVNLDDQQRHLMYRRRRELIESLSRRGVLRPFDVPGKPDLEGTE